MSTGGRNGGNVSTTWFSSIKDRHSRQQQQIQQQMTALYKRISDGLQGEKAINIDELIKWASSYYASALKGMDKKSLLQLTRGPPSKDGPEAVGDAKLEKYRSRGLTYSVRHISPAIVRRQRADRSESKELTTLVEELKHHRDLWDTYVTGIKNSMGAGVTAEQKDGMLRQYDDKLYDIYKGIWPILDKLNGSDEH